MAPRIVDIAVKKTGSVPNLFLFTGTDFDISFPIVFKKIGAKIRIMNGEKDSLLEINRICFDEFTF